MQRFFVSVSVLSISFVGIGLLHAGPAVAITLLDNTNNLSATNLQFNNGAGFGGNSAAYTRLNGFTFATGNDAYNIDSIKIPLGWNGSVAISPTIRVSLFENSTTTATTPANGATAAYTQDFTGNTFNSTINFYSFIPSSTWLLKANTGYSVIFGTNQTSSPSNFWWATYSTAPVAPSSTIGFQYKTNFFSTTGGSSYTATGNRYPLQLNGTLASSPPAVPSVPGALPILGVVSALGTSRRLRRRIK
jgi:hypothetical protein